MTKDYVALTGELNQLITQFAKRAPEAMQGFSGLMTGATKDGALTGRVKELIALGIAVAARCEGCIGFHVQKLVKMDVSDEEFVETLAMAVYMGGGPSLMYAMEAMRAHEQFMQGRER